MPQETISAESWLIPTFTTAKIHKIHDHYVTMSCIFGLIGGAVGLKKKAFFCVSMLRSIQEQIDRIATFGPTKSSAAEHRDFK